MRKHTYKAHLLALLLVTIALNSKATAAEPQNNTPTKNAPDMRRTIRNANIPIADIQKFINERKGAGLPIDFASGFPSNMSGTDFSGLNIQGAIFLNINL